MSIELCREPNGLAEGEGTEGGMSQEGESEWVSDACKPTSVS